jgi:hypothetical protein
MASETETVSVGFEAFHIRPVCSGAEFLHAFSPRAFEVRFLLKKYMRIFTISDNWDDRKKEKKNQLFMFIRNVAAAAGGTIVVLSGSHTFTASAAV